MEDEHPEEGRKGECLGKGGDMRTQRLWALVLVIGLLYATSFPADGTCGLSAGDRVRLTMDHPDDHPTLLAGHQGTVVCFDESSASRPVLVSWDDWMAGHENVGSCTTAVLPHRDWSCWWVSCDWIEPLKPGVPDITDGGEPYRFFTPQTFIGSQAGQSLEVSFNVVNAGTGNPQDVIGVDVYASKDTTITPSDYYLGSVDCIVPAGASLQQTLKTVLPTKLPTGYYYIGWIMDPLNLIPDELDETNNTAYVTSYRMVVSNPPGFLSLELSAARGGKITSPAEAVLLYLSSKPSTVVATADPCCSFVRWMGTAVEAGKVADLRAARTTITVDGSYTLMAVFDGPHMLLEDFEDYNDGTGVNGTWVDGVGWRSDDQQGRPGNETGATLGNAGSAHGGILAMAFDYDNSRTPYISEVSRRWGTLQNWAATGADTLSIWYRGARSNSAEPLYVVVEDVYGEAAVIEQPDRLAARNSQWTRWTVLLQQVQAAGVMLSRVVKVTIGVGDRANPVTGGAGTLYIDDISLAHEGFGNQPPELPAVDRPVAHWKLDEISGDIAHDSVGSHDGQLYGGPMWSPSGAIAGALGFDGIDDYVDTLYSDNLTSWTISAWVKSPAAPSARVDGGPVHREQNYQINWDHSNPSFRGTAALAIGGAWYGASFGPLEANRWYHLAATYDGDTLRAYKNGVLITTNTTPSGSPDYEPTSLKLGRHAVWPTQAFAGTVDDVRIYDQVLNADDVRTLAGAGKSGSR